MAWLVADDAVVFYPPWLRRTFDHYGHGTPTAAWPTVAYPRRWDFAFFASGGRPEVNPEVRVAALPCRHRRTWHVVREPEDWADARGPRLERLLAAGYTSAETKRLRGVRLRLHAGPRRGACRATLGAPSPTAGEL